jgi:hypothetical protein
MCRIDRHLLDIQAAIDFLSEQKPDRLCLSIERNPQITILMSLP